MENRYETWRRQVVRERGSYAALEFWAKCLGDRLHRICDDEGRIHLGGRDPAVAIALRGGGAGPGDRRLIRKLLPVLLAEGTVWREGDTLVLRDFDGVVRSPPQASEEPATEAARAPDGRATGSRPTRDERATGARAELTTEYDVDADPLTRAVSLPSLPFPSDPPKPPVRDPHPEGSRGKEHYRSGKGSF